MANSVKLEIITPSKLFYRGYVAVSYTHLTLPTKA